jgi:hypothetical protein
MLSVNNDQHKVYKTQILHYVGNSSKHRLTLRRKKTDGQLWELTWLICGISALGLLRSIQAIWWAPGPIYRPILISTRNAKGEGGGAGQVDKPHSLTSCLQSLMKAICFCQFEELGTDLVPYLKLLQGSLYGLALYMSCLVLETMSPPSCCIQYLELSWRDHCGPPPSAM